ncbi:Storkhead-box protein 1, partial [Zootermopsis nevadensis]
MSGRSPGVRGGPGTPAGGSRCLLILQRCLAIQLQKVALLSEQRKTPARGHDEPEYWMYDSGYLLFQGFLEANLKCFWNASLLEAMRLLEFQGYVAPGVLLVTASACALEVVRAAWARNVLKPPNNYVIAVVG